MIIRAQHHGFTLLELMIVVAIVGVLAVIAAPSFNDAMDERKLSAAVETIYSDIRYARSESIKRSIDVTVTFSGTVGSGTAIDPWTTWQYVIADGGGAIKTVLSTQFSVASVATTFASNIITFDFVRGTAIAGTVTITSDNGSTGTVTVSTIGRIKSDY
jgi:type IV fimbrial biogenesis protein FimT